MNRCPTCIKRVMDYTDLSTLPLWPAAYLSVPVITALRASELCPTFLAAVVLYAVCYILCSARGREQKSAGVTVVFECGNNVTLESSKHFFLIEENVLFVCLD